MRSQSDKTLLVTSPSVQAEIASRTEAAKPIIDYEHFCVLWRGKECALRNLKPFKLYERLSRRPGTYISIRTLLEDLWPDALVEKNTVQQTASRLQRALREAGMNDLLIDGQTNPGHYALVIDSQKSQRQVSLVSYFPHISN